MMSRWAFLLHNLVRQLWFTAALYSLLGVVTALSALALEPYLPIELTTKIGADAVDRILGILASSMLAVTTFSIATMVSAYAAAASGATPRATRLLVEDRTAQTALATFLGAFLFSVVSIIALASGAYGASGRILLFFVTIGVVILIVLVLVRWIDKLSRLGRVTETIDQVEKAAAQAMRAHARAPFLGAREAAGEPEGVRVSSDDIGYVQYVDTARLSSLAEKNGASIMVAARPGAFVTPDRALAVIAGSAGAEAVAAVREAFTIGDGRSYVQDPRFGMIVLSEIASRALSPAVNDPGTAIDVIGTAVRVLAILCAPHDEDGTERRGESSETCPGVTVVSVTVDELLDDVFTPIARDGAGLVEVGIRLQKALRSLAAMHVSFAEPARRQARLAIARAEASLTLAEDKERVREAADWV
jgi:uncharacterized membrane protein